MLWLRGLCALRGGAAGAAQVADRRADLDDAVDNGREREMVLGLDDVLGADAGTAAATDGDGGGCVWVAVQAVHGVSVLERRRRSGFYAGFNGERQAKLLVSMASGHRNQPECDTPATDEIQA